MQATLDDVAPTDRPPQVDDATAYPPEEYQWKDGALVRNADGTPRRKRGRPPKGSTASTSSAKTTAKSKSGSKTAARKVAEKVGTQAEAMAGLMTMMGTIRNDQVLLADAKAVMEGRDTLVDAIEQVCAENVQVRKALERLFVAGSWGQLAFAVGSMALPIAINHGVLAGVGFPSPFAPPPVAEPEPEPWTMTPAHEPATDDPRPTDPRAVPVVDIIDITPDPEPFTEADYQTGVMPTVGEMRGSRPV